MDSAGRPREEPDPLDPESEHGRVYRALIRARQGGAAAVAAEAGVAPARAAQVLAELGEAGAAVRLPGGDGDHWEARPPDALLEARVRAEEHRLAELRATGGELARLFRLARQEGSGYQGLEVVDDRALILAYFERLQRDARYQVRAINRPPYVGGDATEQAQSDLQASRMAAGIRYQAIYHDSVYADPLRCAGAMAAIGAGEQARVLVDPPVKMLISDDDRALVALDPAGATGPVSLIVHPSALLNALVGIFGSLWQLAVPLSLERPAEDLDASDRAIVTLMAAGATDEVIARRLNISRRSVVRRTGALLERLGATTRFQAGVQAARRGWL